MASSSSSPGSLSSADGHTVGSAAMDVQRRARVRTCRGYFEGGPRDGWPWTTYPTYLDGVLLGNACDEAEGWRWVEDMIRMETRDG